MNIETKLESHEVERPTDFETPTPSSVKSKPPPTPTPDRSESKKKKKGIFGGLFGGKKGKKGKDSQASGERPNSRTRGMRSPMSRKLKGMASAEGSI